VREAKTKLKGCSAKEEEEEQEQEGKPTSLGRRRKIKQGLDEGHKVLQTESKIVAFYTR
jgi:hypothetical protein